MLGFLTTNKRTQGHFEVRKNMLMTLVVMVASQVCAHI